MLIIKGNFDEVKAKLESLTEEEFKKLAGGRNE